ncbi:hypothetical protein PF010_g12139 [Phytophthora fragariae]|uniref:Uncharacterized protein n=1 Tax=Phytophthora fragariae TaxID=53985 RepID=A0A6G0L4S4_9STRA|nr:hypothetical protein PF010_g12139 [Phytophthora fragariae]
MKEWIVQDDLSQSEVEARLQFCHFETNVVHEEAETKAGVDSGSYLGAVHKGMTALGDGLETEEQRRMKQLCMQPAQSVTKLRARTEDEDKALLMILNHEIEVPGPPAFLKQSRTSTELAYFTDIFLAIEYPLYAHLAPGQQFGQNMSRHAIMRHIYAGPEAAPSHKQEVEEFKEAFSRIALNADTRVVTITFKGRQSAAKWVNWRLPLASKLLTLVDYDGQRERARTTPELVRLDYYDFTVAVRKGEVTSRDMHWILPHALGLQVQEMTHPDASSKGLNDKEWRVTVKGAQCPQILRSTTFIETEQAAVMIHHHTIHVNWPCATCHSPEHPTTYCKMEAEAIEQQRKLFDMRLTGTLPSADDNGGNGLAKGSLPTTLEQLRKILTKGAYPSRSRVSNKKDGRSKPKSLKRLTQSPSKKITHGDTCGPSLSIEWEQHRRPGGTTGITSGDPPRSKPEKDEGWQNGERGLQQQPDATPRVDGPINGTYPAEATNHGVQKELEVHHKDDGIEVV